MTTAAADLLTIKQAATAAGVTGETIRMWISDGLRSNRTSRNALGIKRGPSIIRTIRRSDFSAYLKKKGIKPCPAASKPTSKTRLSRTHR